MRILVVEDDALVALDLAEIVRDLGHEVVGPFMTVPPALASCRSTEIDYGLLDFNLGAETSAVIADELTARDVPFAFATGYRSVSLPERYHAAKIIPKPVSPRDVARALERAGGSDG